MFFRKIIYLLHFLITTMICEAQQVYDVETLPMYRTKQYSMDPYKKIIIFSASRTGSSLLYNIFKFIFEDNSLLHSHHNEFDLNRLVLKTHKSQELDGLEGEKILYIFTYRNPLHGCISNYRICPRKISDKKAFAQQLLHRHCHCLLFSETMEEEGRSVSRLKYETFANDLDFIFHWIEEKFMISIDLKDKNLIKKGYSKENIHRCTQHLVDFHQYLPISGFHGNHISLENYVPPPDFLYWLDVHLEKMKYLFQKYGYFLDSVHGDP